VLQQGLCEAGQRLPDLEYLCLAAHRFCSLLCIAEDLPVQIFELFEENLPIQIFQLFVEIPSRECETQKES
jgi:hypothetical protein